jgi:hypothetical protein
MDDKDHAQNRCEGLRKTFRLGHYSHHTGGDYIVYGLSVREDTLEVMVDYYSVKKRTRWHRKFEVFNEIPEGIAVPRFQFEREATLPELLVAAGFGEFIQQLRSIASNFTRVSKLFEELRGIDL